MAFVLSVDSKLFMVSAIMSLCWMSWRHYNCAYLWVWASNIDHKQQGGDENGSSDKHSSSFFQSKSCSKKVL